MKCDFFLKSNLIHFSKPHGQEVHFPPNTLDTYQIICETMPTLTARQHIQRNDPYWHALIGKINQHITKWLIT